MSSYDCIIIGGGLSGLAAAIRMAHFGKRVRLFEKHALPGGMNSYYPRRDGVPGDFDTGLHALTNFVPEAIKDAPLNRILRQLRIRRSELELCPQSTSLIATGNTELLLDNDFAHFQEQIAAKFPDDAEGFARLVERINAQAYSGENTPWCSANQELALYISSQTLIDLLRMPVMYYGCASADDMDFQAFATMFKSVLIEGFARPRQGMRPFLQLLVQKAQSEGAELSFGTAIASIHCDVNAISAVTDNHGETHSAATYITTAGAVETMALCDNASPCPMAQSHPGAMGFIEGIFQLPHPARSLGFSHCIAFLNFSDHFEFHPMSADKIPQSVLMCAPGNYVGCEEDTTLRISAMTDSSFWLNPALPSIDYRNAKQRASELLLQAISARYPELASAARPADLFTPKTIQRFTGHCNGAIYGSPDKLKDFATGISNLAIAGTDQGLLGIVGSMLSGIIAANLNLN